MMNGSDDEAYTSNNVSFNFHQQQDQHQHSSPAPAQAAHQSLSGFSQDTPSTSASPSGSAQQQWWDSPSDDIAPSSCSTLTGTPPSTAHYQQTFQPLASTSSSGESLSLSLDSSFDTSCDTILETSYTSSYLGLDDPTVRPRLISRTSSDDSHHSTASDLSTLWSIASNDQAPAYSGFQCAPEVKAGDLSFALPITSDFANDVEPSNTPTSYDFLSPTPITSDFLQYIISTTDVDLGALQDLQHDDTDDFYDHTYDAFSESLVYAPFDPNLPFPSIDRLAPDDTDWTRAVLNSDDETTLAGLDVPGHQTHDGAEGSSSEYLKLGGFLPAIEQLFATYEAETGGLDFTVPAPATAW